MRAGTMTCDEFYSSRCIYRLISCSSSSSPSFPSSPSSSSSPSFSSSHSSSSPSSSSAPTRTQRMLLGLCLSMHTPLILWFLLLPCIAAWRLYPPDKTLVLPCPVALENTTGSVSWFRDGQRSLLNTSESSSLVIKDPWYTESGNYTCCYAFSNWTGNADCFSSYIVFADKTELPPNLLRDTLPQPGETPIFKGITYWQPAMLLSFRPVNFFKRTNFSCLYFIRTTTRIPKIEWFFLHSNSELSHNISTEELPCPSELLDGLHGIYEEDDFYGIRNRCFRSVLTLNYRALGQDGELVHPRLGEGEASTCVSDTLNAAHNLSRRDLANRLNACPKNALLLSWLSMRLSFGSKLFSTYTPNAGNGSSVSTAIRQLASMTMQIKLSTYQTERGQEGRTKTDKKIVAVLIFTHFSDLSLAPKKPASFPV
ncbi:hypothetical protein SprV_0200557000 [Sparganum proliferum]